MPAIPGTARPVVNADPVKCVLVAVITVARIGEPTRYTPFWTRYTATGCVNVDSD